MKNCTNVHCAETDENLLRCLPVLQHLRPYLTDAEAFVAQVRRQSSAHGYSVAFVEDSGEVCAVAGYRFVESLAWGRHLYVDDLVAAPAARGKGYGRLLLDWLKAEARAAGCEQLHLDSGTQRHGAHRFYLGQGMDITSFHFAQKF